MTKFFSKTLLALLLLIACSLSASALPEFVNSAGTSATLVSSAGTITSDVAKFNKSFQLTGSNYLTMTLPSNYTSYTFSCWIYTTLDRITEQANNIYQTVFSTRSNNDWGGTYMHIDDASYNQYPTCRSNAVNATTNNGTAGNKVITRRAWHHFAYVRNSNKHYYFVDGYCQAIVTQSNPNSCETLYIGALKGEADMKANTFMTGYVDDIAVWSNATHFTSSLPTQASTTRQTFTPPTAATVTGSSDLVALFNLDTQNIQQNYSDSRINYDPYGSWKDGKWWQEIGYAGVGNDNEVLAVGEFDVVPMSAYTQEAYVYDPVITNIQSSDFNWTLRCNLLGLAKDTKYVKRLKVWARAFDPTFTVNEGGSIELNKSSIANTFTYPFDYRDPVNKSGAKLLAVTDVIPEDGAVTFNITTPPPASRVVIYITADMQDVDIDELPFISATQEALKPSFGANFVSSSFSGTLDFDYSYKVGGNTTTGSIVDAEINETTTLTQATNSRNSTYGSRMLIAQCKTLYAPNDFYSKFYRIPAIATANDGSLIAISDARKYHIHDVRNDIDILARRSTDGGKTWSNPVTIAKGNGGSDESCAGALGFGDAGIAALPNNKVVATMIYGYGIRETNTTNYTQNFYCLSSDNGQSWSAPIEIPMSLTNNERGCIAPGNMCVVKNGALAGKVLAAFRSYATLSGSAAALTNRNYILLYDPENGANGTWSRINVGGTGYIKIGTDDEAHILEVGNNVFLLSIRDNGSSADRRTFVRLEYSPTTGTMTYYNIDNYVTGITAGCNANGDIMNYTAKVGDNTDTYQIMALPTMTISDPHGGGDTRSNLNFFYGQYNDNGMRSSLAWNKSVCMSDPIDGENSSFRETAQYSSFTTLEDGTIAFLMENYPQLVRFEYPNQSACVGGDWMMRTTYMQLRIGDIIPGAEPVVPARLLPPVITPKTRMYDSEDPTSRPAIVINNPNDPALNSTTYYYIDIYDPNGTKIGTISGTFTGASKSFAWSDLKLTIDGVEKTFEELIDKDWKVVAHAFCAAEGYTNSYEPVENYYFDNPVRKLVVVAKENAGWGDPYLQANLLGTVEQGEIMTVSVGKQVYVNAANNLPFIFKGFSLSADQYIPLTPAQQNALNYIKMSEQQMSISVPSVATMPNNDGDKLVIYAWYESSLFGLKTRVKINHMNEDGPRHNDWYPVTALVDDDFPEAVPGLVMDNIEQVNNSATSIIPYNYVSKNPETQAIEYPGLDANATIMPDSRCMQYNAAVVAVPVTSAQNAPAKIAPATGQNYIMLQGTRTTLTGSYNKVNWFTTENGVNIPAKVIDLKFSQLVPKNVTTPQVLDFNIVFYVFEGDVAGLSDITASNTKAIITHPIRYDGSIITGVDDVDIVGREVKAVKYYNVTGVESLRPFDGINIVVTEYTDGTRQTVKVVK